MFANPEPVESECVSATSFVSWFRYISNLKGKIEHLQLGTATSTAQVYKEVLPAFDNFMGSLPSDVDLTGAAVGIRRLQLVYGLPLNDVMEGTVDGRPSRPLTVPEILDVVQRTYNKHDELYRINMLNISLSTIRYLEKLPMCISEKETFFNVIQLVYRSANCLCSDQFFGYIKHFDGLIDDGKVNRPNVKHCRNFTVPDSKCRSFADQKALVDQNTLKFFALCRGQTLMASSKAINELSITPPHKRVCHYMHRGKPELMIQPFKVEVFNEDRPRVAMLHGMISDKLIKDAEIFSRTSLARGKMYGKSGHRVSPNKVNQLVVVPTNYTNEHMLRFQQRIGQVSGLNHNYFQPIQVINYGPFGVYNLHVDIKSKLTQQNFTHASENTLATFINYMNNAVGGATVFPELGLRVSPLQGNALMFVNLFRNGSGNHLTVHGSCPVLYGPKWITNQWVSRFDQLFSYPCTLREDD